MLCIQVVRSEWSRRQSVHNVFYNKSLYSEDMMRIARLHTDILGRSRSAHVKTQFMLHDTCCQLHNITACNHKPGYTCCTLRCGEPALYLLVFVLCYLLYFIQKSSQLLKLNAPCKAGSCSWAVYLYSYVSNTRVPYTRVFKAKSIGRHSSSSYVVAVHAWLYRNLYCASSTCIIAHLRQIF